MNWNNLKNVTCPDCSRGLSKQDGFYRCFGCNFRIGHQKFDTVVNNLYKPKTQDADNLSELNNLGHEKIAEDFSDSKILDNL